MPDRTLRKIAGLCGIAGPIALTVYFAAPALTNWPYAGASAAHLTAYANSHKTLFFAGAWFQGTGTLLSIVFFLAILGFLLAAVGLSLTALTAKDNPGIAVLRWCSSISIDDLPARWQLPFPVQ